jgi:hypothetical protein
MSSTKDRGSVHVQRQDGQAEGTHEPEAGKSGGSPSSPERHPARRDSVEDARPPRESGAVHAGDSKDVRKSDAGDTATVVNSKSDAGRGKQTPADTRRTRVDADKVNDNEFEQLGGKTPETKKKEEEAKRRTADRLRRMSRHKRNVIKAKQRIRASLIAFTQFVFTIPDLFNELAKFATMAAIMWSLWRALSAAATNDWLAVVLHLAIIVGCVIVNDRI